MRITIATGPLLPVPALRGGAIPRMWEGLAREFAAAGHEVCVFARADASQPESEVREGVRYRRWGGFDQSGSLSRDLLRDLAYALGAWRRLPAADILVTNDFWLPAFAGRGKARSGRLVVNANRFPKGQYGLYRHAARIAAASGAVRDAVAEQTPALAPRIKVFPNPVDLAVMHPGEGGCGAGPARLLYVGRIHPEKGVHVLAAAFRGLAPRFPDWRLRLVGPWRAAEGGGGEAYLERVRAALGDAPADVVGPVFGAQALAGEYRSASLFCYPSLAEQGESFGLAPLEAMACGLAPVVSRLACFADFLVPGETGWQFDHRAADPAGALADALAQAMSDAGGRQRLATRAAAAARAFGYAEVARAYLEDFGALTGQAHA